MDRETQILADVSVLKKSEILTLSKGCISGLMKSLA